METTTQTDYLKENADNIWFVLGAYFFAFFPWMIMHNIDFISEKWRTCHRTRKLAHIHLASSIFPIIYVAVYAEAQRRDEDNKELGAALAALMFNGFQLMRTIMGLVQLNAFVAWCKHAVDCMRALQGNADEDCQSSNSEVENTARNEKTIWEMFQHCLNLTLSWCKSGLQCICTIFPREVGNGLQGRTRDSENCEPSANGRGNDVDDGKGNFRASEELIGEGRSANADSNAEVSVEAVECAVRCGNGGVGSNEWTSVEKSGQEMRTVRNNLQRSTVVSGYKRFLERASPRKARDMNGIEDVIMVNNMVVDNELGGREVTVLPSLKKIWSGVKRRSFTPSKWLQTDRVIFSTVRWSGAFLCGMGEDWSIHGINTSLDFGEGSEILESIFSNDMGNMRRVLQNVEWDLSVENDGSEFLSVSRLSGDHGVELTGEMCLAYGPRDIFYDVSDTTTVDAYSFEFNSLVSSYPTNDWRISRSGNRERIGVGLVHSVLLAKHLGVGKLKAIRRFHDRNCLTEGHILRNAFKLLLEQTNTHVQDDSKIWEMFEGVDYQIPIFPYRMQMVGLWDEKMHWRVLQASAHQDILNSRLNAAYLRSYPAFHSLENEFEQQILANDVRSMNLFDYCVKWTVEQIDEVFPKCKGSLGVVLETVRTSLAEWVAASEHEPNWAPKIPTARFEFNTFETSVSSERLYIIWICQRELQRKIANTSSEEKNFPGGAALIMLFILGFPLLRIASVQDDGFDAQDNQDEVQPVNASSSPNRSRLIDLDVKVWRAWTPLAPQDISLVIRYDSKRSIVSLKLQNGSGAVHFVWQDWVDAAMGCMKGFQVALDGKNGYGRKIVRPELRKPMVEMCPLRLIDFGLETIVERTNAARIWTGWPPFDVRICKFEVDQWSDACNIDLKSLRADGIIEIVEGVIETMISAGNDGKKSTRSGDVR